MVDGGSTNNSSIPMPSRILRARAQGLHDEQGDQNCARPIGHFRQVKWKPARQQRDFDGHFGNAVPAEDTKKRQQYAGKHIAADGATARQNCFARAAHMVGVRLVPDHLERKIGFHAGAHVKITKMAESPAVMRALDAAQIVRDLLLQNQNRRVRHDSAGAERIRTELSRPPQARIPNVRHFAGRPAMRVLQQRRPGPRRRAAAGGIRRQKRASCGRPQSKVHEVRGPIS